MAPNMPKGPAAGAMAIAGGARPGCPNMAAMAAAACGFGCGGIIPNAGCMAGMAGTAGMAGMAGAAWMAGWPIMAAAAAAAAEKATRVSKNS